MDKYESPPIPSGMQLVVLHLMCRYMYMCCRALALIGNHSPPGDSMVIITLLTQVRKEKNGKIYFRPVPRQMGR